MMVFGKKGIALVTILSIFCSFTIAHAVGSQFNVRLTVGADVTAPSSPTALAATAVSTSQIDLSWTASTDDVAVTGYRVYRDAVFVGTSVGTTYSDIGLSSNTTYSYTVSAVDAASNESAQSSSASATTFTSASNAGGGISGGLRAAVIYDVLVIPAKTGATIKWKTTTPTLGTLLWGVSDAYELGQSAEIIASTEHQVVITSLTPGTSYVFKIDAINAYGVHVYETQRFTTLTLEEGATNATAFTATAKSNSILLDWKNPRGDFESIRIVRSDTFYPSDPNDGMIVFEGDNEVFSDTNVAVGTRYYYTLFVKYVDGTYSSGIVADARILNIGETATSTDVFGSLPQAPSVHPLINALTFADFDFIQNGKKIQTLDGNTIPIDGSRNLTVSLKYEKVPEVLKTIAITLTDPEDETKIFSFLLRVNETKTAYLATIAPLGKSGEYHVRISIVDYKNRGLKKIVGNLVASAQVGFESNKNNISTLFVFIGQNFINPLLLLILLGLIVRSLFGMVKRNKKNQVFVSDIENSSSSHDSNF